MPTSFTSSLHISDTMNGYDTKKWDAAFSEIGQDAKDTKNTFKPTDSILPGQTGLGAQERSYHERFL